VTHQELSQADVVPPQQDHDDDDDDVALDGVRLKVLREVLRHA
jgi:hypothetical protein